MYDLVVLGGGSGGLNVATAAARVGAKVALIEKYRLGGECTHTACVPSKALIKAANLAHTIRTAGDYGLRIGAPEVDFAAVMARVRRVVAGFAGSDSGKSLQAKGIDVYRGSPAFEAYDTVVLDGRERISGHRFVIATGSRPAVPEVPGLESAGFLDNGTIWDLHERPRALVVIGAGPVGLEFGQAFARLGTPVTILSDGPHILPAEDPEVADRVQAYLAGEGIAFHLGAEVTGVSVRDGQTVIALRGPADGATHEVACSHILVATGRLANVEGLNLEAVGIHADPRHGIEVDDHLQTRAPHVYAIGDVLGRFQFTHAAEREAAVAFQNAVLRLPKRIDYAAVPWATFTDPEVATVGRLTGFDASEEVRVFRAEYDELDRARIDGRTHGFAKLVASPSGKIRGVTIVGDEAATVLQEFVLAIEHGLTLNDLASTVHTYPTYSGLVRKLANQFTATRLEGGLVQTALRLFYGFRPRAGTDGPSASPSESPGEAEPVGHSSSEGHGH
jgi:pyruvate/2-oxoglutarate dehydrogenase complex dihydrolipoamide dehydrogenase (E3) component